MMLELLSGPGRVQGRPLRQSGAAASAAESSVSLSSSWSPIAPSRLVLATSALSSRSQCGVAPVTALLGPLAVVC